MDLKWLDRIDRLALSTHSVPPWFRRQLPSSRPRFESQEHHICLFMSLVDLFYRYNYLFVLLNLSYDCKIEQKMKIGKRNVFKNSSSWVKICSFTFAASKSKKSLHVDGEYEFLWCHKCKHYLEQAWALCFKLCANVLWSLNSFYLKDSKPSLITSGQSYKTFQACILWL